MLIALRFFSLLLTVGSFPFFFFERLLSFCLSWWGKVRVPGEVGGPASSRGCSHPGGTSIVLSCSSVGLMDIAVTYAADTGQRCTLVSLAHRSRRIN